jgi:8-oxo-dGTP diphosphatase
MHAHSPPESSPAPDSRPLRVAAAVVRRGGAILLTQRPPDASHPLQWELPGGKIETGESPEQALVREIEEELGVRATPLARLGTYHHAYPDGPRVEIVFVECSLDSLDLRPSRAVHAMRWVRPADIDLGEVLAGDHPFLRRLAEEG